MTRICLFGRRPIKRTKSFSQLQVQRKARCCSVDMIGPFTTTPSLAPWQRATQRCSSWPAAPTKSSLATMARVCRWQTDATEREIVWTKLTKLNARLLFSLLDTIDLLYRHPQKMRQNMLFTFPSKFRISLKSTKKMDLYDARFFSYGNGLIGRWPFKTSKTKLGWTL